MSGPRGEQLGQDELPRRAARVSGDGLDVPQELAVAREVLALEARVVPAPILGREVVRRLDAPGEDAAAEGRVGDERDPQIPATRQRSLRLRAVRVRYCIRGPPFVTRAILHRALRARGV